MAKKKGPTPKRRVQHPRPRPKAGRLSGRVLLSAFVLGALLISLAAFALGRSDDDDSSARSGADDGGPVHVHGLGINPADRSLLIATHSGMYRVAPNESKATRIGESRQDTMGFTVAGPDYFLGSGHPDITEAVAKDLPPHLGLIESRDAGRTWRTLSLLGEADFHVLRFAEQRVYGYDASNDRLLVSGDRGKTWKQVNRPAPLVDLAVDPTKGKHIVAAGEGGLYESADEGRTWKRLALRIGLLAWPSIQRLYLVDAEGSVQRSTDQGRRWTRTGSIGGQPAAFLAQTDAELYVALHDGTIKQSRDGGRTWTVRSTPGV
jgi:photosystem II stability/assembly factor-like uncharacterized protein